MKWWRILALIWALPGTVLVWAAFILPAWALGYLKWTGRPAEAPWGVWSFQVMTEKRPLWKRLWKGWRSFGAHNVILLCMNHPATRRHEIRHTEQALVFGLFYLPLYMLAWLALFCWYILRLKSHAANHAYWDNPFERDARQHEK